MSIRVIRGFNFCFWDESAFIVASASTVIPPGSLILGSPAKVVRTHLLDEQAKVRYWAEKYVKSSCKYLERL